MRASKKEKKLSGLIVELEHREAAAKEARAAEKAEIDALKKSISVLAEEIESGQGSLFGTVEPSSDGPKKITVDSLGTCSGCGQEDTITFVFENKGGDRTSPLCKACSEESVPRSKRRRRA